MACAHIQTECRDCGTFLEQPAAETLTVRKSATARVGEAIGYTLAGLVFAVVIGGLVLLAEVIWQGVFS